MNALSTRFRTRTTAVKIQRLVAVLSLAIALVAIPAFNPADAGAYPMSERQALRLCGQAGGRAHYSFTDEEMVDYTMTCTGSSGRTILWCWGYDVFVNCW